MTGVCNDYAAHVARVMTQAGFVAEAELSTKTLKKKIRDSQVEQWNIMLVVGQKEVEGGSVNIRTRAGDELGIRPMDEAIAMFKQMAADFQ